MSFFSDFFEFHFLQYALITIIFLSIAFGIISPLIVSKRYSFIGESIAHSSLLSLTLTFSLFSNENSILFIVLLLVINNFLSLILAKAIENKAIPADSHIGLFLIFTLSLGMILYKKFASDFTDLPSLLFGDIILLEFFDIIFSLLTCLTLIYFVLRKKMNWIYFVFDQDSFELNGFQSKLYHYGLFSILSLLVIAGIKMGGILIVNSLIIVPGMFALQVSKNIKNLFLYSITFSLLTSTFSLFLSNAINLPFAPTLAITQVILLFIFRKK